MCAVSSVTPSDPQKLLKCFAELDKRQPVPDPAKNILKSLDEALDYLETSRMGHFNDACREYRAPAPNSRPGIEHLLVCELYCLLQKTFGDLVFTECPGIGGEKVALWLNDENCPTYLEIKVNCSNNEALCSQDFYKLKNLINTEPKAMAIEIHFVFYTRENSIAEKTLEELAERIPDHEYWKDTRRIRNTERPHFLRLAFGSIRGQSIP